MFASSPITIYYLKDSKTVPSVSPAERKTGDLFPRPAFTALYHRYWRLLFSVAVNKLHNIEDAEELVQDVFTSLWRRRKALTIEVSLKSYLAGAVKLKVYTALAQKYRLRDRRRAGHLRKDR